MLEPAPFSCRLLLPLMPVRYSCNYSFENEGFSSYGSGDSGETAVGTPIATNCCRRNYHPAFQFCWNEGKIMKNPSINLINRIALLLLATFSIVFAAACEPAGNSDTPSATSPSPATSSSPANATESAPVNSPSPAASPAASPSPNAKTKSAK